MYYIVSQIFGALALVTLFITFQAKKKRKLLFWLIISNILWALMFTFTPDKNGSLNPDVIGMLLGYFGAVRTAMFLWLSYRKGNWVKPVGIVVVIVCIIVPSIFTIMEAVTVLDWLLFVIAPIYIVSTYFNNREFLTASTVIYSFVVLLRHIIDTDIVQLMGILIEVSVITSIVIFYIRFFLAKKKKAATGLTIEKDTENETVEAIEKIENNILHH